MITRRIYLRVVFAYKYHQKNILIELKNDSSLLSLSLLLKAESHEQ